MGAEARRGEDVLMVIEAVMRERGEPWPFVSDDERSYMIYPSCPIGWTDPYSLMPDIDIGLPFEASKTRRVPRPLDFEEDNR